MVQKIRLLASTVFRVTSHDTDLDERVLEAMSRLPRHLFVPDAASGKAYANTPLGIGFDQTISQPFIVALMTSLAQLAPSSRVLEVGTGSGYQTAVLAALADQVYSVEKIPELAAKAATTLAAQGISNVRTCVGDGHVGWPEYAPFDAILVTAAPSDVPKSLSDQLAAGGRLVIPIGEETQALTLIEKSHDGSLRSRPIIDVRFVPMTPGS